VRFTRDVLGDPARAAEIEEESLEDYAERRRIQITNPSKRRTKVMAPRKTNAQLEQEIADLLKENRELQDQLDAVADIVTPQQDDAMMKTETKKMRKTKRIPTKTWTESWPGSVCRSGARKLIRSPIEL
jgi:hypothetical protein